ncbi:MAG: hypothetical protein M3251_01100, partial [Thermoproteota archaeon]|nr:hypothetical protein [Thermoproteota archaeon]
ATWRQRSSDREEEEEEEEEENNWVFSSNTLDDANFGVFVSDPQSPSPESHAPEHPIITQPEASSPAAATTTTITITTNSTAEVAIIPLAIKPSQNLTIAFIDVGQGDSILVFLPNTKTLLIDGGEREGSDKVLAAPKDSSVDLDCCIYTIGY